VVDALVGKTGQKCQMIMQEMGQWKEEEGIREGSLKLIPEQGPERGLGESKQAWGT
jgi:hypothetical protein